MKLRNLFMASAASALLISCSSASSDMTSTSVFSGAATTDQTTTTVMSTDSMAMVSSTIAPAATTTTFTAEVWADNWFALYINGVLVGEDSVSITTEKSFNSDTITFTASYPFTIAMVTKDFKQDDSGLEYIGTNRQQMGDGGFVAQFTDTSTGKVVASTNSTWRGLVVHQAPLDTSCEKSASPMTECTSKISTEPANWAQSNFNDSSWPTATVYTKDAIGVKDGYNSISWTTKAQLIWTSNLEIDNTILWRHTVGA